MERYDLIIIGSGPAGLTASIYAERACLHTLVIEKNYMSGGQVLNTYDVDNYPGFPNINGFDLSMKFKEHADAMQVKFQEDEIVKVERSGTDWLLIGKRKQYQTKAIIIASGCHHKKLQVPGEEELSGMGVSYCATCDGAFFKDRVTAVVGGGDVAVENAIFLAHVCQKVYLIHRREELRAAKRLQQTLSKCDNVQILWNRVVDEIQGEDSVQNLVVRNVVTKENENLTVDGVFIAVGIQPISGVFQNIVKQDEAGYIIAGEDCKTSAEGIYAVGDVRTKNLRQIVTAVADGACAVASAQEYLISVE